MLVNSMLPVAERMLKKYGEFYPYGVFMGPDGSITHVGAADLDTDRPKSGDLIFILKNLVREMAAKGECKAAGVAFDVLVSLPTSGGKVDAIQLNIEHADGYSAEVFFPYRLIDGELIYGATLAQEGKQEIFAKH